MIARRIRKPHCSNRLHAIHDQVWWGRLSYQHREAGAFQLLAGVLRGAGCVDMASPGRGWQGTFLHQSRVAEGRRGKIPEVETEEAAEQRVCRGGPAFTASARIVLGLEWHPVNPDLTKLWGQDQQHKQRALEPVLCRHPAPAPHPECASEDAYRHNTQCEQTGLPPVPTVLKRKYSF